jgi:3-deoxy-D-manno-octulosonic-acid transferase
MGINEDVAKRTRAMPLSQRALLRLYFGVSRFIPARLIVALVRRRAAKNAGEDSVERAPERVAWVLPERPEGRVVWLQSIGPGDSTANLVLLEALRALDPTLSFVVTTRTLDGLGVFRKAAEGGGVSLLLAPLDTRAAMTRFIDHWRPDVAVFCEGDLWPNALDLLRRRGIPMALINGQFNGRLGRLVRKLPAFGRWMMGHLDLLHIFSPNGDEEAREWVCDD